MEEQKGQNQQGTPKVVAPGAARPSSGFRPSSSQRPPGAARPSFGGARRPSFGNRPSFGGGARPASGQGARPSFGGRPGGASRPGDSRGPRTGGDRGRGGRPPFRRDGGEREKDAFNEQVLDLRRVTRVVAGGKRFRFRATVVIGDGRGKVGVGVAKGADVQSSVAKAKSAAKKKIVSFKVVNGTIPHEVKAKFSAAEVIIRPAKAGHGLMAGGAVRAVLLLAGVKDVTAKCLGGTKNKLTNAMATITALKQLKPVK